MAAAEPPCMRKSFGYAYYSANMQPPNPVKHSLIAMLLCSGALLSGCLIPHNAPQDDPEIIIDDTPPEQLGRISPPSERHSPAPANTSPSAQPMPDAQASAEVRRLDQERADLEARVAALQQQRAKLEAEVSGMRSESAQHRQSVAEMDQQSAQLQTDIRKLEFERNQAQARLNETRANTPARDPSAPPVADARPTSPPPTRPSPPSEPMARNARQAPARQAPAAVEQPLTSPLEQNYVVLSERQGTDLPNGVRLTLLDDDADTAGGQPGVEVQFDGRRNRILAVGRAVRITAKGGHTIRLTCVQNDMKGKAARFEIR